MDDEITLEFYRAGDRTFDGTGIVMPAEPTWREPDGPVITADTPLFFSDPVPLDGVSVVTEQMEAAGRSLGRMLWERMRSWRYEGRHGRQWHRLHPTGADRLDPDRLPAWMEWLD